MILLLAAVSVVTFTLVSISPIDPLQANVGQTALGSMSEEQIEKLQSYWGVDTPPVERYLNWAKDFVRGDMGVSLLYRQSVSEVIKVKLGNSLFLLVITLVISIPLSMGAGIYLSEYAKKGRFTNFIRTCIEILSSLPSVVVGLFGYLIFVVQFQYGFSIISGALALTVFNLPQMTRNVEDGLRNVHHTQREAGLALGLSRWETVVHVVIPEALPSIVTGIVLASGRIFGEAAALIYTAGQSAPALDWSNWNPLSVTSPISIFRQAETLAVHIWKVNSEGTIPDATQVSQGSAAVLLIFILIFNLSARYIGKKLHAKLTSVK